jgi:hypothetical protein
MRVENKQLRTELQALRPGGEYHMKFGYYVDDAIYMGQKKGRTHYFDEIVRARAMVDGKIVAEVEKAVRELQNF